LDCHEHEPSRFEGFKLHSIPRGARPRCGVITKKGTPCQGQALLTGLCYLHSGFPRGVSPEGQARQAAKARETMKKLWAERWRPNGKPYSAEGRARISEAQKRRHAATRAKRQGARCG
jgi:hypothetical protein